MPDLVKKKAVDKTKKYTDASGNVWYLDRQELVPGTEIDPKYRNVFAYDQTQKKEFRKNELIKKKNQLEHEIASRRDELMKIEGELAAIVEVEKL